MSTCPGDALHHLYVDGEIPSDCVVAYKHHIDSCPECQKKIIRIGALKKRLHADSAGMESSPENFDAGFDRLMVKMRYHAVSRENQRNETGYVARRVLPWAAAVIITVSGVYAVLQNGVISRNPTAPIAPPAVTEVITIPEGALENARYSPRTISMANGLPSIPDFDVFRPRSLAPKTGLRVYLVSRDGSYVVVLSDIFTFTLDGTASSSRQDNAVRANGEADKTQGTEGNEQRIVLYY
jgi:hypothetical protein